MPELITRSQLDPYFVARIVVDVKDSRLLVRNTVIGSLERHFAIYLILIAFVPD
jgi:hypothetical protein